MTLLTKPQRERRLDNGRRPTAVIECDTGVIIQNTDVDMMEKCRAFAARHEIFCVEDGVEREAELIGFIPRTQTEPLYAIFQSPWNGDIIRFPRI